MDDNIISLNMNVLDDCMNKWPDESWRGVSPPLIRLLIPDVFIPDQGDTRYKTDKRPKEKEKWDA